MNEQAPIKAWKVAVLTILVLLVLAVGAIPVFSQKIQQDLGKKAQGLLDEQGIKWASVLVDGRDASIVGAASDPNSLEDLKKQLTAINGVRVVKYLSTDVAQISEAVSDEHEQADVEPSQQVTTAAVEPELDKTFAAPYHLLATYDGAQVEIQGLAIDQETSNALDVHARQMFGDDAVNAEWKVADGQPDNWVSAVKTSVAQLARLGEGQVEITDTEIRMTGEVKQTAVSDSVNDQLKLLMEDGYDLAYSVEALDSALLSCQHDFGKLLTGQAIHFRTGRAQIRNDSVELLNKLLDISMRCKDFDIEVAGHTDSQGGASRNDQLSLERAQSVVNWLAKKGLDVSRMAAVGHGEKVPVADNNTRSGRAKNRRIEITVRGN